MTSPRAQELELDLNRGTKAGIAKQVQNSPQRYSQAFKSRAPRLSSPAGCKTAFRGNMYSYNPNRSTSRRQDMRPDSTFSSKTPRFKAPQPSIGADRMLSSSTLERDARHWSRRSFYQSQAPRSVEQPRPLTADIDTNDLPNAGHHVDGAVLPLAQASRVSPRKVASMLNRESRSSDPVSYAANDPRFRRLHLPYDEVLGPGSYDTIHAEEYMRASTPADGGRAVFASRLPQHEAPGGPRPFMPAAGTSAFAMDARSWDRPIYRSGSPSGRSRERGPQLGSWEGLDGLGRAHSPEGRSPDTVYHGIGRAPQKRALVDDQASSARRYSASFHSRAERLMTPDSVKRALQMSPSSGLFDVTDMTGTMAMSIGSSGDGRPSSPFKSTQPRFLPDKRVSTPAHDSAAAEDRRAWSSAGQPITTKAERATIFDETTIKPTSPGPYIGLRDWSPPSSPIRNAGKKRPTFGDSIGQLPRAGSP